MNGKQILITGASNGIGLAAAEALVALGASIAIVGRSETGTRIATARIKAARKRGATVDVFMADLASHAAVRKLAGEVLARYPRLDVLINNAGAMYARRQATEDGIELTWAVNHLAPFLLTTLLLDRLKEGAPARIVTTASAAHQGARIPFEDLNAERSYRASSATARPSSPTSCSRENLPAASRGPACRQPASTPAWWRQGSTATTAC